MVRNLISRPDYKKTARVLTYELEPYGNMIYRQSNTQPLSSLYGTQPSRDFYGNLTTQPPIPFTYSQNFAIPDQPVPTTIPILKIKIDSSSASTKRRNKWDKTRCFRCGLRGHWASSCYVNLD
jgi:hypothetical protein